MRFVKFFPSFLLAILSVSFLVPKFVYAQADRCYCYTDITQVKPDDKINDDTLFLNVCEQVPSDINCGAEEEVRQKALNPLVLYIKCEAVKYDEATCTSKSTDWKEQKRRLDISKKSYAEAHTSLVGKFIPACLLEDKLSADCRDISIFFTLAFNVSNYLFSIIGAVALLMFVYGGFIMILSQGESEKIEKGKNAMVAAIIGLAIAFGGYMIVKYLGEALQLKDQFRLK